MRPKIAFVVQRCGIEVGGGAEAYALSIAKLMSKHWDIEIITTCALDYMSWDNHYPKGIEHIDDIKINRFEVDHSRDIASFNELSDRLFSNPSIQTIELSNEWMTMQGPVSSPLLEYIEANRDTFDKFIFFTYLYGTSYYGLPLVEDRAYLFSFAHDESPIYLPIWDSWFSRPKMVICSSIEERDFLQGRFDDIHLSDEAIGLGVDIPNDISSIRFRQRYDIYAPYILYIGRIDESKGCDHLFRYFLKYKAEYDSRVKLILIGKSLLEIPESSDIIHLGFVEESVKFDALKGCEFLVNSSPFESLSIVLLEAWSINKPVLVNGDAKVMVGQCERSGGGRAYEGEREFMTLVDHMLNNLRTFRGMDRFVDDNYRWSIIKEKLLRMADED